MATELERQTGRGVPIYSEARRMELLEGLCSALGEHVGSVQSGNAKFEIPAKGKDGKPVMQLGSLPGGDLTNLMETFTAQAAGFADYSDPGRRQQRQNELKSYCGQLVEAYEDELSGLLERGIDSFHEAICSEMAKKCDIEDVQSYVAEAAASAAASAAARQSEGKEVADQTSTKSSKQKEQKNGSSKKKKKKKKKKKEGKTPDGKDEL